MAISYTPLEKNGNFTSLGIENPKLEESSLYATSTFLYGLLFTAIIGAAFYKYIIAGTLRMQASEGSIRQSNEIFKKVTLGLLGVFSLFLIIFTVNKDLLTGGVGFGALATKISGGGGGTFAGGGATGGFGTPNQTSNTGTNSRSCESKESTISSLNSSSGVCGNVQCTILNGCQYQQYLPIIQEESSAVGLDYKIAVVIMCRESGGRVNPPQRTGALANSNGSADCGLMQINRRNGVCDAEILDPRNNIKAGVQELKAKISRSSSLVQPGIPAMANAFADYNCCATGGPASSPSNDCTQASGFPYTVPKWVCPINPGTGQFNMCAVKNYACEVSNCLANVQ